MWTQEILTVPPESTAQKLLHRLKNGITTYLIRYGDSDLKMLEDLGHSSKTQTNCPKLRRELRECLKYYRDRQFIGEIKGIGSTELIVADKISESVEE